ncbi:MULTISPECIES: hypothetical protein [Neobacillus]|uniref:Uncharacterized protein n=1 Tax=Neobacillus rhizophilus TaxID=2833579 RepID=A0A942U9W7_9BACI|nr:MULTISPECIES: hypothetical protein [Neobacillus]MBS4215312.1 hypothetical protein [Neobacillus rhizophilus]MBU8919613.1 hypothetical protein [Bacillus sp. FJAT-29953]
MELGVKKKRGDRRLPTISGFLSFLVALISLAGLNVALLIKEKVFPGVFIIQLPIVGFFLGVIGLFTLKRSRLYAIWGLSLNIFLLIFTLLMIISSLGINYKP